MASARLPSRRTGEGPYIIDPGMTDPGTIPETIGEYRVKRRLGAGGMGEVYLAQDDELERAVAIKLIRADQSESANSQERFRREAKAIAKLDHPAIVKIYHNQKWRDHHCIVMEFVEGETLTALLAAGPLAVQRAAALLRQIAEGLAEAHAHGIVHRDLKTSNVMVTSAGRVKILDFGLAKRLAGPDVSISAPGTILGTPYTMSPEQATGQRVNDRTDLFSLGVLGYELLTGTSPFRAETTQATLRRVIAHYPPPVRELEREVPQELSDLIDRLLEKYPAQRPAGAQDVVGTLTRWMESKGSGPFEETLPEEQRVESRTTIEGRPPEHGPATQPDRPPGNRSQEPTIGPEPSSGGDFGAHPSRTSRPGWISRPWRWAAVVAVTVLLGLVGLNIVWVPPPLTVAVLGFASEEPDPESGWLATAMAEMLSAELRAHRRIRVLKGEWTEQLRRAAGVQGELGVDDLTRLRADLSPELADAFVTGVWKIAGDELSLRIDLRELGTRGESPLKVEGSVQDLSALARAAAGEIGIRLGVGEPSSEEARGFAATFPAQPESLRFYAEGLMAWRAGDSSRARDRFAAALLVEPGQPLLHFARGQVLQERGYGAEAKAAARAVLAASNRLPPATRLEMAAKSYEILEDWEAALSAYETLFRDHPDEIVYGLRRAEMQALVGRFPEALKSLDELRAGATGVFSGFADVVEADARLWMEDGARAKELALEAVETGRSSGAPFLEAEGRLFEAMALERLGEYDDAVTALDQARILYLQVDNLRGMLATLTQKGIVLAQEGNLQEARDQFESYRGFFADRGDEMSAAIVGVNLAYILDELGDLGEAEKVLKRSVAIFQEREAPREEAQALLNLGAVYQNNGRLGEAQANYERALDLFRGIGDRENIAKSLTNLGEILYWTGNLLGAESRYREALEIDRDLDNEEGDAYGSLRLGEVVLLRDDSATAREYFKASLESAEKLGDELAVADARLGLARLEIEESNFGHAESLASQAESVYLSAGMDDAAVLAKIVRARALMGSTPPEVERAQEIGEEVEVYAVGSEDRQVRFEAGVLAMRLTAARGKDIRELSDELEQLAMEAEAAGFVLDAWAARLTLGEIEMGLGETTDGRARLEAVRSEAETRGWMLFARRASRRLGG